MDLNLIPTGRLRSKSDTLGTRSMPGAIACNTKRTERGLRPMECVLVDLVDSNTGTLGADIAHKISSSAARSVRCAGMVPRAACTMMPCAP